MNDKASMIRNGPTYVNSVCEVSPTTKLDHSLGKRQRIKEKEHGVSGKLFCKAPEHE
jgi:hypothetical protein